MKKVFKLLFSRFNLILIAVILQLCLYIVLPIILSQSFPAVPINLILSILAIVLVLAIINSDMTQEAQIPLIILCIIAPILGIAFSLIFLIIKIPRKVKKYARKTVTELKDGLVIDEKEDTILKEELNESYGQFNYLYNIGMFRSYQNTATKFFKSGEEFFEALCSSLKVAEKYIFMEYFIVEDGKMWQVIYKILLEKVKQGVEVRFMYDDLGTIYKLPSNFAHKLKKAGINCVKFNEYSNATSSIYNNRDHRKITVIDGKIGFVGGVNLADEYINEIHPYGVWKDSALMIKGEATKSLVCMFLQLFNIQSKIEEDFSKYYSDTKEISDGVVCPFGDGPKYAYGDNIAENVYLNLISHAKDYIYISTPYLIIDSKIKSALCNASMRGVKVVIVTPHIPDKKIIFKITRSSYKELQEKGVIIKEYKEGFIHSKEVVIDDKIGVVGTINLDYRSFLHHYECGIMMYKSSSVLEIKNDFEEIFKTAIDMKDFKQNIFTKLFCALIKLYTPLF